MLAKLIKNVDARMSFAVIGVFLILISVFISAFLLKMDYHNAASLTSRDYRQFWMGHKGDIESRYTTNKNKLPPEVIEDMREAYKKSQDHLQTAVKGEVNEEKVANINYNTEFLGTSIWQPSWEKRENGQMTSEEFRNELLNIFLERMGQYYDYHYYTLVEEFRSGAPLYYLIFFTTHPLANKILKDIRDNIEKWKKEDYIRDVYRITMPIEEFSKKKEKS